MYSFMLPALFKRFKAQGHSWAELPLKIREKFVRADGKLGYRDTSKGIDIIVIPLGDGDFVHVDIDDCYLECVDPDHMYLITAAKNEFGGCYQNNYASDWKEACECANYMSEYYDFVEILYGYPGHWESVEV